MKIYNEVVWKMEDSGELTEVYSDSEEYDGPLAELKTTHIDDPDFGVGTQWAIDEHGYNIIAQGARDKVASYLGGYGGWHGYESVDHHKGVTSPSYHGGEGWYQPGNPGGPLQGTGWIGYAGGEAIKQDPAALHRIADDYYGTEPMFRRDFYTPYFRDHLETPVAELGGQGGAYGSEEQLGSEFVTSEYYDPRQVVVGQDLPNPIRGYLPRIQGEDPTFELGPALTALEGAKEEYESEIARLTWEPGGEVYDEQKATLDAARAGVASGRQDISDAKMPAYEKAQAAEARTGMAYSAPAAQYGDMVADEASKGYGELSVAEQSAVTDFEDARIQAEKDLSDATDIYDDAVTAYETTLGKYAGMGEGAANEILGKLANLSTLHYGLGTRSVELGQDWAEGKKSALVDAGMYRENMWNNPIWSKLQGFAGPGGVVQTYAKGMEEAAKESMQGG